MRKYREKTQLGQNICEIAYAILSTTTILQEIFQRIFFKEAHLMLFLRFFFNLLIMQTLMAGKFDFQNGSKIPFEYYEAF